MTPLIQLNRQLQYLFIALLFANSAVVQSVQARPIGDDHTTNMAEKGDAVPDLGSDTEEAAVGQAANDAHQRELRRIEHKIAQLRDRLKALNASLITTMSERETSMANDVELLHASIIAAQLESVDTAAAYREAKSVIADLDDLRQHAIADLALPSDYTPPDVTATTLPSVSMDPKSVLASIYEDFADNNSVIEDLAAKWMDLPPPTPNPEDLARELNKKGAGVSPMLLAAAAWDGLAADFAANNAQYSQVVSGLSGEAWAIQSAINGMARNVR